MQNEYLLLLPASFLTILRQKIKYLIHMVMVNKDIALPQHMVCCGFTLLLAIL
jgi:hypothetical protein